MAVSKEDILETIANMSVMEVVDLVEAMEVATSANIPYRIDNDRGEIRLELTANVAGEATREIASIQFRGVSTGLSYLIFANAVGASGPEGLPANVEMRASRIVIR